MMLDGTPNNSLTYELASVSSRLIAMIIDEVILLVLSIFIGTLTIGLPDWAALVIGFTLNFFFHWYFWTRRNGQTPGKYIVNIKVIKTDGSPISDMDCLMRVIGYMFSGLALGLGYLWAVFDPNAQTWHDKIAHTYVVKADKQKREVKI